ncbi:hypothetical protein [Rhizobium sp. YK2]|uniref:hypothetical protein n=1 Tax=Rhizobium sp. YK2 TaxID=1860096 RepID=UPI00084C0227|nr:hypothetical protein [Rhizobium sp. YK2]OEC93541.1 hypothetical protein A9Z06_08895 [Rhizobium sp. YK2]
MKDGSLHFEEGKGANFAITDHIYVLEWNGERDDSLENWFSVDENGLAVFAHAADGTLPSFNNEKLMVQAIRACIALGSRSAYGMFLAMSFLQPETEAVHEAAVENVLPSIGQKFRDFATWDFRIFYDLSIPLVVSERPFLDFTFRGFSMRAKVHLRYGINHEINSVTSLLCTRRKEALTGRLPCNDQKTMKTKL